MQKDHQQMDIKRSLLGPPWLRMHEDDLNMSTDSKSPTSRLLDDVVSDFIKQPSDHDDDASMLHHHYNHTHYTPPVSKNGDPTQPNM